MSLRDNERWSLSFHEMTSRRQLWMLVSITEWHTPFHRVHMVNGSVVASSVGLSCQCSHPSGITHTSLYHTIQHHSLPQANSSVHFNNSGTTNHSIQCTPTMSRTRGRRSQFCGLMLEIAKTTKMLSMWLHKSITNVCSLLVAKVGKKKRKRKHIPGGTRTRNL